MKESTSLHSTLLTPGLVDAVDDNKQMAVRGARCKLVHEFATMATKNLPIINESQTGNITQLELLDTANRSSDPKVSAACRYLNSNYKQIRDIHDDGPINRFGISSNDLQYLKIATGDSSMERLKLSMVRAATSSDAVTGYVVGGLGVCGSLALALTKRDPRIALFGGSFALAFAATKYGNSVNAEMEQMLKLRESIRKDTTIDRLLSR